MKRFLPLIVAGLLVTGPAALADDQPPVPVGTRIAAQTHPAVLLTMLDYTAKVTIPSAQIKQNALSSLAEQASAEAIAGKIATDERTILKWMFERMAADPETYLEAVLPYRSVDGEAGGACTGWWVTPDGYMVTGAHCVQMSDQDLAAAFSTQALRKFNEEDAKEVIGALGKSGDAETLALAQQLFATFNSNHLEITGLQQSLNVVQTLPGGGVDKSAKLVPAELVSVGENYPGKDFALLKVNGLQNLPTVPLGEDADVRTGDTLYISGFPGLVTNLDFLSLESRLEPALTEGPYNALRSTKSGVPYIQTQAPSYHGNSGGPVFSASGKVIGMLIAGTVDATGAASESESFVLPVSVIKEKLNEKNVSPSASITTTKYGEALNDFFNRHYQAALPKFREVQALHPAHPYVGKYVQEAQMAISSGKDETPWPMWVWAAMGGGALLVVGLTVLLVVLLKRRRKPQVVVHQGWQQGPWDNTQYVRPLPYAPQHPQPQPPSHPHHHPQQLPYNPHQNSGR
ncbi:S1 family peptidase [Nonomuraea soli]|uniref:S1-C subfamily serine protease n=1 Tax=Nonomuraea soli TaxID=1032476 RepID=A0A7W0HVC3_9ACTN|nr:serine protease [Nonomuraea soli]MBA2896666.1 S1-C subfamily serine protease [Nonomuraea soli]